MISWPVQNAFLAILKSDMALGHLMSNSVKNEKKWKNHDFDFLTGSERFFGDFEKMINFRCFLKIFKKLRKSSKINQKWNFWKKRLSKTWFSARNQPEWYPQSRFSTYGDPFYDIFKFFFFFRNFFFGVREQTYINVPLPFENVIFNVFLGGAVRQFSNTLPLV